MDYVRLGATGLRVSRLALGCMSFGSGQDWMLSEEASQPIIRGALDGGINFFDTANMYSRGESELILGRALKAFGVDDATPIEETLEALDAIVRAGKVRYLGASTMAAWQFAKMLYTADLKGLTRFVSMQNSYSLLYREEEREMIPLCRDQGVGLSQCEWFSMEPHAPSPGCRLIRPSIFAQADS